MYRYRLTRRFVLPEEVTHAAADLGVAKRLILLVACTDAVIDDTLLRSEALKGARILRTRGNCVAGPGVDPTLLPLIDRMIADGRFTELVVCGHSHCRQFTSPSSKCAIAESTQSESWYQRRLRRISESQLATERAKANVVEQLAILKRMTYVQQQKLQITGLLYLCESGTALVFDEGTQEFRMAAPSEAGGSRRRD